MDFIMDLYWIYIGFIWIYLDLYEVNGDLMVI